MDEVLRYRAHVDEAIERILEVNPEAEVLKRIELGANHEEQHQELLLTDVLHAFYTNPLRPSYVQAPGNGILSETPGAQSRNPEPVDLLEFSGGLVDVGFSGDGFCFDNELAAASGLAGAVFAGDSAFDQRRICGVHCGWRI